jgi:ABC-type glutathione transport system ATPase component
MSTPASTRLVEMSAPRQRLQAYEPLLTLEGVVKHFPAGRGKRVHSVDGVSLEVGRGEVFGLVGESGCGKSATCHFWDQ